MKLSSKTFVLFIISMGISLAIGEIAVRSFVTVRNVGPSFTEYDEVYGKRHKKSFSCDRITPEYTMHMSSNSLGFRGPEPGRFPDKGILIFGDSFTEGFGANDDEVYPELVRRALEKQYGKDVIPVLNLGMGDNGNGNALKFLRNEGRRFNPRLVVLQLTNNDFMDNIHEQFFTLNERDSLLEHPPAPAGKSRIVQKILEAIPGLSYSHLVGLLKQAMWASTRATRFALEETPTEADRLTYRIIDETLSLCEREHWPALVLAVRFEKSRFEKMKLVVQKHGVQFVNTPIVEQRPELFYKYDGHWTAEGHVVVANQVLDAIAAASFFANDSSSTLGP